MGVLSAARPEVGRQPQSLCFWTQRPLCSLIRPRGQYGAYSIIPLLFISLFLGLFAFPASSRAQIDGWLVGYRFECCPQGNVNGQFLVLALVDYPLTDEAVQRSLIHGESPFEVMGRGVQMGS